MIAPVLLFWMLLGVQPVSGLSIEEHVSDSDGSFVAVVAFHDRTRQPERMTLAKAREIPTSEISHVWIWSEAMPPVRFEQAPSQLEEQEVSGHLRIRVAGKTRGSRPMSVVAGPALLFEEVQEDLLPRWPLPESGVLILPRWSRPWRVRLLGESEGSWWSNVPAAADSVVLTGVSASDRVIALVDEQGNPLAAGRLSLLDEGAERGGSRKLADFRTDRRGVVTIPTLPSVAPVVAVASVPGRAPVVIGARPEGLPAQIRVPPGTRVIASIVDSRGTPLTGATVVVSTFLSETLPVPLLRLATADARGRAVIEGLPRGRGEWRATSPGRADAVKNLDLVSEEIDLGQVVLVEGVPFKALVLDDRREPVSGAVVEANGRRMAVTDQKGRASLTIDFSQPVDVAVSAPFHRATSSRPSADGPLEATFVLQRSFKVVGRLSHSDGSAVDDFAVHAARGERFEVFRSLGSAFSLELDPFIAYRLEFRSAGAGLVSKELEPGLPGEMRDLGVIEAPDGLTVSGRVLDRDGSSPVGGARIWLPRPSVAGPLMAWALRDLLETRSDGEGKFLLRGLPSTGMDLYIDAPSFARMKFPLNAPAGSGNLELGDLLLEKGASVRVTLEGADDHEAVARIDIAGLGLPMDQLTAPISAQRATFHNVPRGRAIASVWRRRELLCRVEFSVADDETNDVRCDARRTLIRGEVFVGANRAAAGTLIWVPAMASDVPTGTIQFGSGGARQHQLFSPDAQQLSTTIGKDGRFEEMALVPGTWNVLWVPERGRVSAPQGVVIPPSPVHHLVLRYPGGTVTGVVLDREMKVVEAAEIRNVDGGGIARTGEDGSFALSVGDSGRFRLQASHRGIYSPVKIVEVRPDGSTDPVQLVLQGETGLVIVRVEGSSTGGTGAFAFLDSDTQPLRMTALSSSGDGEFRMQEPLPRRVRAAAVYNGVWIFGPWVDWEAATRRGISLVRGGGSSLLIRTKNTSGRLEIRDPSGWRVDQLLQWIGAFPTVTPQSSRALSGLPVATYEVTLNGSRVLVQTDRDKATTVSFE